jgi:hypothetical protein
VTLLRLKFRLAFALCALSFAASAATSTTWEVNGFSEFLKGHLSNLSLSASGVLQPGPSVRWNVALNQPALWTLAPSPDGSVYAGTGHQGRIYRIDRDGKSSLIWSAQESEVFALCVDAKGALFAGTSPNGGIYRIENGQGHQIWRSPAKYIWALQAAPDGTLFVATGEQGRIYHLDAAGQPASGGANGLYYETGQSNVTALALGANGHLLAGSDPNGILYDISGPKQGTILLDSSLPEIRAIAVDPEGIVYAAAMGGAVSTRSAPAASSPTASSGVVVATTPTVITVTEDKQSGAKSDTEQSGIKGSSDQSKGTNPSGASAATSNPAVVEVGGVEKSALYRINLDRTVETLRNSKEDNVYDLRLDSDGSLIFSTDDRGRIYRWSDNHITLLAEPGDGETTRLLQSGNDLVAGLSNPGRLLALGPAGSSPASYESQVHDSTNVARWGHLQWRGTGSGVLFRTRTGNTARPDATWSKWSDPISGSGQALIQSPAARFIQWRAEWPAGSTAQIGAVDVPYLPQNASPVVHSITVTSIVGTNPAKSGTASSSSSSAYSITVTDTGEPPAASSTTSPSQTASRLQTTQTQVSWQADDPDNDKLVYTVYFRADDENDWQLIRSRMFENTLLLDADVFADGRYYFKVVASDAPSNAVQFARSAELISSPVLIDNTPPLVTLSTPRRNGATLEIDVDATDSTSPLRLCEYSLDAGFWQPIEATDGVTDSPHERFHLHLDKLRPGEHLLVFRVYDAANNAGLARVILR